MLKRGYVVRDFDDIVEWDAGHSLQLEKKEVGQRRLGTFDLRREHGLLAHVSIEKKCLVR